jgi:carbon starvation protein
MSALKLVLWAFLAILGSVALAFVTGFVNPHEKVNRLWLVVAAGSVNIVACRIWGRITNRPLPRGSSGIRVSVGS